MVIRRLLLSVAALAIALAVFAARPVSTPGPLARDFEAYWAAGSAWNAHADAYGSAIWSVERKVPSVNASRDELLPFVGPPATLLAWSAFARRPYVQAAQVWWLVLALALLALVALLVRGSGAPLTPGRFLTALALAIAFAPISSDLALGQLALPAFFGAALLTVSAGRSLVAGVAGACIAFAQPNAALGLASQAGRNRVTLAMGLGALVSYALGAITYGWDWPQRYAIVVLAHSAAERWNAIQFSLPSIAYGFGATQKFAQMAGVLGVLLAAAAAVALAVCLRDRFARFAAFSTLAPFVATFFHEHDLLVAYAAALWCALRTHGTTRTIALSGTLLVAVDWLGLAQRPTGFMQAFLLAIAAWATFEALGTNIELRRTAPAVSAIAVLFAAAATLAARHTMPIWPDALGHFHAASDGTAATTWLAEQRASGLLAVVPAWALLRSLSLLGCALLAYAIYRHSSYCRTA